MYSFYTIRNCLYVLNLIVYITIGEDIILKVDDLEVNNIQDISDILKMKRRYETPWWLMFLEME
jgi:hypothetical protein